MQNDVVVVGLGTLGSTLFQLLTRKAITAWPTGATIFLADFDRIASHNLSKSAIYTAASVGQLKVEVARHWAKAVNPQLRVVALPQSVQEIGLGPFLRANLVFSCADTYSGKMAASRLAWQAGTPLVIGELAGGRSLSSRFRWFRPGGGACLECNWLTEYSFLETSFSCSKPEEALPGPVTQLSVAARTAAFMIETGEALVEGRVQAAGGELRIYPDVENPYIKKLLPVRNPSCLADHQVLDRSTWIQMDKGVRDLTLGEVFAMAAQRIREGLHLPLAQFMASSLSCVEGHRWSGLVPLVRAGEVCPACGRPGNAKGVVSCLTKETAAANVSLPLTEVVPPGDVLHFRGHGDEMLDLVLARPAEWSAVQ